MKPTDKQRLDWISTHGSWVENDGLLGIVFLPSGLENGQSVREAIDQAILQERRK